MKISYRLILAFVIAVMLSSVAGVLGITFLKTTDTGYSEALVKYGFSQGDIGNIGRHFQRQRATILYLLSTPDAAMRSDYAAQLAALDKTIGEDFLLIEKTLDTAEDKAAYATLTTAYADFKGKRDGVIAGGTGSSGDALISVYRDNCTPASDAVATSIDALLALKTTVGNQKSDALTAQTQLLLFIMISVIVISVAFALILALLISRGISRPLVQMEHAAAAIAEGDYDTEITYQSKDEVGQLAQSMRTMSASTKGIIQDTARGLGEIANGNFDIVATVTFIGVFKQIESGIHGIITKLSDTMLQIRESAEQVSSGSDQVSSGAQALSQGATEQASSVEELSATINEISENVKENARNASNASIKVDSVSGEISGCNKQMHEMIEAMAKISSSSQEIGKVIKTIEDIAFQTNILALNAAVEAARAGAAGKGFAVVADEVRNLASKSAEAAKGTTALIEGSIKAVENGTRIADATAHSLLSVVEGAEVVAKTVTSISAASNEQANSITQVTMGLEQISSVVQTNSATAEESAAASEELNGQAQMLKSLVEKFNLRTTQNTAVNPDYAESYR